MLLKNKKIDYKTMITLGQASLCLGFLLLALSGSFGEILAIPDFFKGLLAGMGAAVMGISIVLNVRGMVQYRKEREKS